MVVSDSDCSSLVSNENWIAQLLPDRLAMRRVEACGLCQVLVAGPCLDGLDLLCLGRYEVTLSFRPRPPADHVAQYQGGHIPAFGHGCPKMRALCRVCRARAASLAGPAGDLATPGRLVVASGAECLVMGGRLRHIGRSTPDLRPDADPRSHGCSL